jgi:hypothetical protein
MRATRVVERVGLRGVGGAAVVVDAGVTRGAGGVEGAVWGTCKVVGAAWGTCKVMGAARGAAKVDKVGNDGVTQVLWLDRPRWRSDHQALYRGGGV